jgi:hypothetical protein
MHLVIATPFQGSTFPCVRAELFNWQSVMLIHSSIMIVMTFGLEVDE